MDVALLLALLVTTIALLVTQVIRVEATCLALIAILPLCGLLSTAEALSGFSCPATITVTCMLVLSAALERTGVVDYVARLLARGTSGGDRRTLAVLALPTIGFSAFLSNTAVVAVMIPVVLSFSRRAGVAPSKLLLPLSYLSILGGTCTLIGTSTNILVDAVSRGAGGPGFGIFEFSPLGLLYLAIGSSYVLFVAPRLLPERTGFADLLAVQPPGRFVTEVRLRPGSRYAGKTIAEVFPERRDVRVIQAVREERPHLAPGPGFVLDAGDVLYLESTARSLRHLFGDPELQRGTAVADEERVPLDAILAGDLSRLPREVFDEDAAAAGKRVGGVEPRMAEAVITPNSRFIGRRVRSLGLSRRHGVQVLAIRRLGRQRHDQLRDLYLHAGDVLLVQGEPAALRTVHDDGDVLLIEGVERTLTFPEKAPLAIAILAAVVLLAATGVAQIEVLAVAGVALVILARCLDVRDAVRAVDPATLFLIAGTIPLGIAIEKAGLAADAARWMNEVVGGHGTWLLVGGLYLFTSLITEVLSNNAAAVLLTPVALGMASQLGIDARPLLVAVAFGASASFATPIGYQTNTLVMGPGGYRFADYLRVGVPLNILMAIVAAVAIPHFWPV